MRSNERRIRLIIIESGKRGPLDRGHSGILVGGTRIRRARCVAPVGMRVCLVDNCQARILIGICLITIKRRHVFVTLNDIQASALQLTKFLFYVCIKENKNYRL